MVKELKLYKIWQDKQTGYDTYSDAVVIAENEEEARNTKLGSTENEYGSWAKPKFVQVEYLGDAKEGSEKGIVCSSFHAG